jgi:hypothetical protein
MPAGDSKDGAAKRAISPFAGERAPEPREEGAEPADLPEDGGIPGSLSLASAD